MVVAVIDDGKILLTKREDYEVWCLPGGSVEDRESLVEAGIREAREETGLDVELTRLVGVYSRLGGGMRDGHVILYAARPVGGKLTPQPNETIDVTYFPFDQLPGELLFGHRQRINDAINHVTGISVRQELRTGDLKQYTRKELYEVRDRSGLSRQQFYLQRIADSEIHEVVEVSGV